MIADGFDSGKEISSKPRGVSTGVIAGAVIGGLAVLLATVLATLCCLRPSLVRRHRSQKDTSLHVDLIHSPLERPLARDANVCPSCYVTACSFCRNAHSCQVQNSFYAQTPLSFKEMRERMRSDSQLDVGPAFAQPQPQTSGQAPMNDLVELVYQRLQHDRPEYSERATTELPVYEELSHDLS
jgi:hypothetical protein